MQAELIALTYPPCVNPDAAAFMCHLSSAASAFQHVRTCSVCLHRGHDRRVTHTYSTLKATQAGPSFLFFKPSIYKKAEKKSHSLDEVAGPFVRESLFPSSW